MRYSLRDLGVAVVICALLAPIFVSLLVRARENARTRQCSYNLAQVGLGLFAYSSAAPSSAYCSGASGFLTDGCIDTHGWVADIHRTINHHQLIDPSNPLVGSKTLQDLIDKDPTARKLGTRLDATAAGVCGSQTWQDVRVSGDAIYFAGTRPSTTERAELIAKAFVDHGYNTNYAASWLLTRYYIKTAVDSSTRPPTLLSSHDFADFRDPGACMGVLTANVMDRSRVSSTNVPFMGCAAPSKVSLANQLEAGKATIWPASSNMTSTKKPKRGQLLTEYVSAGPMYVNLITKRLTPLAGGQRLKKQIAGERNEPTHEALLAQSSKPCLPKEAVYLQDTRSWYAVHSGGTLNMLMADGSIKQFTDVNGDGYINPGFGVPTQSKPIVGRYIDSTIEATPERFFAGMQLWDYYFKNVWE